MICRTIVKDKQSFWNAISKLEDKKDLINDTIQMLYFKNKYIILLRKEEIIKKIDPNIPIMKLLDFKR